MNHNLYCVLLFMLALAGLCQAEMLQDPATSDSVAVPKELEGTYYALAISKGAKDSTEDFRRDFRLVITKDELTFTIKDKKYPARITKIDPKAKPATIDIAPTEGPEKGKTFLGIYTFSSGELSLAFTEKGDRPRDFSGDDDATVLRLRKDTKKGKKN